MGFRIWGSTFSVERSEFDELGVSGLRFEVYG